MMKILWNEATSGPPELNPLWETLHRYLDTMARPDAKVTIRHLPVSANFVRSLYTELLNNKQVVEGTIWAEKAGFDAVVLGCWADPLWEAREVVGSRWWASARRPCCWPRCSVKSSPS